MALKKEAKFVLEGRDIYIVGEKVPVYTNNVSSDEILGYATVQKLSNTRVRYADETVVPHTETTFEIEDEMLTKYPDYQVFYNGMRNRLCIYNERKQAENRQKQQARQLTNRKEQAKKTIFNHIIICDNCDFSVGLSHDIEDIECPNCKDEGMLREI